MQCTVPTLNICTYTTYLILTLQITENSISSGNNVCAARIHKYGSRLVVDDISKPVISSAEVVVKVAATDCVTLIYTYWRRLEEKSTT